jgi:hypothetical protein
VLISARAAPQTGCHDRHAIATGTADSAAGSASRRV